MGPGHGEATVKESGQASENFDIAASESTTGTACRLASDSESEPETVTKSGSLPREQLENRPHIKSWVKQELLQRRVGPENGCSKRLFQTAGTS